MLLSKISQNIEISVHESKYYWFSFIYLLGFVILENISADVDLKCTMLSICQDRNWAILRFKRFAFSKTIDTEIVIITFLQADIKEHS